MTTTIGDTATAPTFLFDIDAFKMAGRVRSLNHGPHPISPPVVENRLFTSHRTPHKDWGVAKDVLSGPRGVDSDAVRGISSVELPRSQPDKMSRYIKSHLI
jgi:hypothetical protein